jgi:hypothetical protein
MKRAIAVLLVSVVAAGLAAAQDKNPVTNALKDVLKEYQPNLVGAAQEMPADKYSFKATPGQMSFGQLVNHVAGGNMFLCSKIGAMPAPPMAKLSATSPKDQLVKALQQSFAFCSQALTRVNDSMLAGQVPFFGGRQVSRAEAMMDLSNDLGDHYSLAATYLRLNGLLPPSAKKKEKE